MTRAGWTLLLIATSLSAKSLVLPPWTLEPDTQKAGFTLTHSSENGAPVAVLMGPEHAADEAEGSATMTFRVDSLRGKSVEAAVWLRITNPGMQRETRLWAQVTRPGVAPSFPGNVASNSVASNEWARVQVTLAIPANARSATIGVISEGGARVEIRDASLTTPTASEISGLPALKTLGPLAEPTTLNTLAEPNVSEIQDVINEAARRAAKYIAGLPDFLCNEIIRRSEASGRRGWRDKDVLEVRVTYSGGVEHYRLVSIDGLATAFPLSMVTGGESEGEFGSVARDIFRPRTAHFDWDHWAQLRDRTVHVFRYTVRLENSRFHLQFANKKQRLLDQIVAYHGWVYIDRDTSEILRIVQVADPPDYFPLRESRMTLDYDYRDVGGQQFLLPVSAEISIGSTDLRSHNVMEFRDYQKFSAESVIEFE